MGNAAPLPLQMKPGNNSFFREFWSFFTSLLCSEKLIIFVLGKQENLSSLWREIRVLHSVCKISFKKLTKQSASFPYNSQIQEDTKNVYISLRRSRVVVNTVRNLILQSSQQRHDFQLYCVSLRRNFFFINYSNF